MYMWNIRKMDTGIPDFVSQYTGLCFPVYRTLFPANGLETACWSSGVKRKGFKVLHSGLKMHIWGFKGITMYSKDMKTMQIDVQCGLMVILMETNKQKD